jgi:peptidoglycan/LPS O-acetylase OafA/YrhL
VFFVYQHNDCWHFFLQLFLASNWGFEQGDSFDGPIWSISVEALAYLFFFLVLQLVSKSIFVNVVVIAVCVVAKLIHNYQPVLDCFVFFYLGGVAAMARQCFDAIRVGVAANSIAWCVACVLPIGVFVLNLYRMEHFSFPFFFVYTPILLLCLSGDQTIGKTRQRIIEVAGNMTYASYLLHFPIQLMIALWLLNSGAPIPIIPLDFLRFSSSPRSLHLIFRIGILSCPLGTGLGRLWHGK